MSYRERSILELKLTVIALFSLVAYVSFIWYVKYYTPKLLICERLIMLDNIGNYEYPNFDNDYHYVLNGIKYKPTGNMVCEFVYKETYERI